GKKASRCHDIDAVRRWPAPVSRPFAGPAHASSLPFYYGCTKVWATYMASRGLNGTNRPVRLSRRKVWPQGAAPQKEANMSIEQFIDNEVKSNDVVLFMKGT